MKLLMLMLPLLAACGSLRPFPLAEPMTSDPDMQPFAPMPAKYFSPLVWDAADNLVFRPISNFFAVDPARASKNVNAFDEVPASSWFTPRLGQRTLTPDEVALGPCEGAPPLDPAAPWTVTGGKPDGENPGFFIKGQDGSRYLLKFDGVAQAPRATAADAIVTRLYHAAGYHTPCNRIVFFDASILQLAPDAKAEKSSGKVEPMTQAMVDAAFARALRLPDGRYRGNASLYLKGKPLGPWRYEGTRDDDPNDVVPHEDRRELRAASVIASWVNHFDSREQNTLDMWLEVAGPSGSEPSGRGYIKHHYIDFGDCFGSLWDWDALSRRWGHSDLFHPTHILGDFLSLGIVVRPWDRAKFGASGEVFGYFDVKPFDPIGWLNEYPNPAFSRLQLADAHWMARIVQRFDDAIITRVIAEGHLDEALATELRRILIGRRDAIVRAWLPRLSTLAEPAVQGDEVCARELVDGAWPEAKRARRYDARAWLGLERRPTEATVRVADGQVCVALPRTTSDAAHPSYLIVDAVSRAVTRDVAIEDTPPLRLHLYQVGDTFQLVGVERPGDGAAP